MSHFRSLTRIAGLGLTAVAVSALLLAACGGGGSSTAANAVQFKSAFASGRIAGFGSVVINGVHYDETSAKVEDEDGALQSASDLKLGMVAEVKATDFGQANNVTSATAQSITTISLMRGPVESVGASSLVVLGQTVAVTSTTVFDDSLVGGLSTIKVGDTVKIFGMLETGTGMYTATRIEPVSSPTSYALRGVVTAYDAMAKTLSIGAAKIDVSGATVPADITVGSLVRVKLQTMQMNGMWVAISVKSGLHKPEDNEHSEVEGTITDFTSTTSFSVDGLAVDATKATFPDGTTGLVKGAHVEVEGAVVNGVLMATKVKIETEDAQHAEGFEVDGLVSAVDTIHSTFVVRGVTVSFDMTTTFANGSAMELLVGARVEVRGALAADGSTINATKITFGH